MCPVSIHGSMVWGDRHRPSASRSLLTRLSRRHTSNSIQPSPPHSGRISSILFAQQVTHEPFSGTRHIGCISLRPLRVFQCKDSIMQSNDYMELSRVSRRTVLKINASNHKIWLVVGAPATDKRSRVLVVKYGSSRRKVRRVRTSIISFIKLLCPKHSLVIGSLQCTRIMTGRDWMLKDLQECHEVHFSTPLNSRISQIQDSQQSSWGNHHHPPAHLGNRSRYIQIFLECTTNRSS